MPEAVSNENNVRKYLRSGEGDEKHFRKRLEFALTRTRRLRQPPVQPWAVDPLLADALVKLGLATIAGRATDSPAKICELTAFGERVVAIL